MTRQWRWGDRCNPPSVGRAWPVPRCYGRLVLATGLFFAGSGLLVLAGGQKLVDPAPLVRALRSVSLKIPPGVVRLVAAGELALGLGGLATGGRLAAAFVAASYALFTGFVLLALARGGVLASCGCFGKQDVRPTRAHAAVTALFALSAIAVAGRPAQPVWAVDGAVALAAASVAIAATAYAVLAVLPLVTAPVARR